MSICQHCGAEFVPLRRLRVQKTCSKVCRLAMANKWMQEMMQWTAREYSRAEVRRATKAVRVDHF